MWGASHTVRRLYLIARSLHQNKCRRKSFPEFRELPMNNGSNAELMKAICVVE